MKRLGHLTIFLFAVVNTIGCLGGTSGEECSHEDDCHSEYSCVGCSGGDVCYFSDMLDDDSSFEYVCRVYSSGSPTDPRYDGGGGGGGGGNCDNAWTCAYDGQASPMCQWARTLSGSERAQTCQVLASMLTSGNAGECCPVCQ